MALFFTIAVAFLLVWFFIDSKVTRLVALGILAFITIVSVAFLVFLDSPERRLAEAPKPNPKLLEFDAQRRKLAAARKLLKPSDVALIKAHLDSGKITTYDNTGRAVERPDLFAWSFSGSLRNVSQQHTVEEVTLRIRLFSCPTYITIAQADVSLNDLTGPCVPIGDRSLSLYNLSIAPGKTGAFSESITFANQPEPRNWRYWANIVRVVAQPE